ncbi:hypothetical protein CAPTEDRAFT_25938, partial [Capitella teleta]
RFIRKESLAYFEHLMKKAIQVKVQDCRPRNDFLLTMVNITKSGNKFLTKDDILANCINIFLEAYSTLSDSMSFTLYLIATHPDVQDKLFIEIKTLFPDDFSFADISKLPYLSMVFHESLRMFPPFTTFNRICNQGVTIRGSRFTRLVQVTVPLSAMHRDPDVWSDPDIFDPKKFSPKN